MLRVQVDEKGCLVLPNEFLGRRRIAAGTEYWLDERDGALILHPRLPDLRKLYIEPITACNLQCRTCMRNTWDDPESSMSETV